MTVDSPGIEHPKEDVVQSLKDIRTYHMRVVVAPAHNHSIQGSNQPLLFRVFMAVNDLSELLNMSLDCCFARLDLSFEAMQAPAAVFPGLSFSDYVLPDFKAQEVEPRFTLRYS